MDKIIEQFNNVPFGKAGSAFQISMEINKHNTDSRKYRHILLQMRQKICALKECEFRRKRIKIDIEEIDDNLKNAKNFEKKRLEIDKEEKLFNLKMEEKLIEDALIEINCYKLHLEKIPEITREEFERNEYKYWKTRLEDDAKKELLQYGTVTVATSKQLESMGIQIAKNQNKQLMFVYKDNKKQIEKGESK